MIRTQVGKRIKELRCAMGLSQEKFAMDVGLDRTYIASVEHGKRNISIVNLARIWTALGITGSNFFNSPFFEGEEENNVYATR